jgi:autotransporter-associated beta strand protein
VSQGAIFQDGQSSVYQVLVSGNTAISTLGVQFGSFAGGSGFTISQAVSASPTLNIQSGGTVDGIVNNDGNAQTFNIPIALTPLGSGASQTWNAAAGDLNFTGVYSGTPATVANNNSGAILTIDGSHNTFIGTTNSSGTLGRGDITGVGGLTKTGSGILTLGGTAANTYTGPTVLNAGTLRANKAGAFGNASALTLAGGVLDPNNRSESVGTLKLQGNATIDMTGTSTLTFADSHSIAWTAGMTLSIIDWTPGDSIKFGTTSSGLTPGQLSQIFFSDNPGNPYASLDSSGNVVPVPEPSTAAMSLLGGFALALGFVIRRKNH